MYERMVENGKVQALSTSCCFDKRQKVRVRGKDKNKDKVADINVPVSSEITPRPCLLGAQNQVPDSRYDQPLKRPRVEVKSASAGPKSPKRSAYSS